MHAACQPQINLVPSTGFILGFIGQAQPQSDALVTLHTNLLNNYWRTLNIERH